MRTNLLLALLYLLVAQGSSAQTGLTGIENYPAYEEVLDQFFGTYTGLVKV